MAGVLTRSDRPNKMGTTARGFAMRLESTMAMRAGTRLGSSRSEANAAILSSMVHKFELELDLGLQGAH